jgi:hypothetical protein
MLVASDNLVPILLPYDMFVLTVAFDVRVLSVRLCVGLRRGEGGEM